MKATCRVILFSRLTADGRQPLMLRATYHRKSRYFSLNIYANAEQWDKKNRRLRRTFPDYKRQNELLSAIEQRAADIVFDWQRINRPFDFAEFERLVFADRAEVAPILWQHLAAIAARLESETRIGYAAVNSIISGKESANSYSQGCQVAPAHLL